MLILRFRWRQLGGHIHVRTFTGRSFDGTFEKNGDLVFDERQWRDMAPAIEELNHHELLGVIIQVKHEDEL